MKTWQRRKIHNWFLDKGHLFLIVYYNRNIRGNSFYFMLQLFVANTHFDFQQKDAILSDGTFIKFYAKPKI
jgi:uncharacterized membrane protein